MLLVPMIVADWDYQLAIYVNICLHEMYMFYLDFWPEIIVHSFRGSS